MRKIGIAYTMRNEKRLIEAYIELHVKKEAEEQLSTNMKCGYHYMRLKDALRPICDLQGYKFEEIITIETL